MRLDLFLAEKHPQYSRSVLQKLIKSGKVKIDGKVVETSRKDVPDGAEVSVVLPEDSDFSGRTLPVIFEDENVVVIDKPAGVLTHSKGALNDEFTVADYIKTHFIKNGVRPQLENNREGVVHRLDRGTSGVIIGAKNEETAKILQKQFQDRKTKKTYLALVDITPAGRNTLNKNGDKFTIDLPIGRNPKKPSQFKVDSKGKDAITDVKVVQVLENSTALLELKPHTGRTHQLRVHLSYVGLPIVGDFVYNPAMSLRAQRSNPVEGREGSGLLRHSAPRNDGDRMMLHAKELEITIPGGIRKTFTAEIPDEFARHSGLDPESSHSELLKNRIDSGTSPE